MITSPARASGLSLMITLNYARVLYSLTLAVALGFGAWVGSALFPG